MRIAVLTFHRAHNCGAMLQAWALKTVLERMGHIVEFPDCNHVGQPKRWRTPGAVSFAKGYRKILSGGKALLIDARSIFWNPVYNGYENFRMRYLLGPNIDALDLPSRYDLVIVGSDQVFNPHITDKETSVFLGEGLSDQVPFVAYAGSIGDSDLSKVEYDRLVAALSNFAAVSTRELRASDQLSISLSKKVPQVLDPTLLISKEEYLKAFPPYRSKRDYIFVYALKLTPFVLKVIESAKERLGLDVICSSAYDYKYGKKLGLPMVPISSDKFVSYIAGAKAVIASSFHGTAVSVAIQKPFLSLREQVDKIESRPMSLLKLIGQERRLVNPDNFSTQKHIQYLTEFGAFDETSFRDKRRESFDFLRRSHV